MKKIYALLIFLCMFSVLGIKQAINIWADDANQIISEFAVGNESTLDFSNINDTVLIDSDLTLSDITITNNGQLSHILQVAPNVTLTLNNVTFANKGSVDNCYIYNYGKVIINNVSFDSAKNVSDILNDSNALGCVTLQKIEEKQNVKIKLNKNAVYVVENSLLEGLVTLSLNGIDYSDLTDNFIGKVLVKGINTFAGMYIDHFKFENAPDESLLKNIKNKDQYFEDFFDKYYIDYAGILGDSIDNPNDGLDVNYGNDLELSNKIDSGDIILTKFSVKLKTAINGKDTSVDDEEDYSFFEKEEDGDKFFYIGGKYATSRLFIQGLGLQEKSNFVITGRVVDLSADNDYTISTFALDNVHSLMPKNDNASYINAGLVGLQKFEISISIDDECQKEYFYASLTGEIEGKEYQSCILLPVFLNGNILQKGVSFDSRLTASTIVSNDIYNLLQINFSTACAQSAISVNLISEGIVFVNTYVDYTNLSYDKKDYLLDNSCKPYSLDEDNNKKYLLDSEYRVYKLTNDIEEPCSEIKDAGSYLIYLQSTDSLIEYTATPYSITITPKELIVDLGQTKFEYDGTTKSIHPTITNICNDDEILFNITNNDNIMPGTYVAKITIDSNSKSCDNYSLKKEYISCKIIIEPGTITREQIQLDTEIIDGVETKIVTYDGNEHTVKMLNSIDGITFNCVSYINAGEYYLSPTFGRDPNLYKSAPELLIKLIIKPQVIDLSDIEIEDVYHQYDGSSVRLDVPQEILGQLPEQFNKTVTITGDNVVNASDTPYKVYVSFNLKTNLVSTNYKVIDQTKIVNIYISKIDFDLSLLEFEDKTIEFDGQEHSIGFKDNFREIVVGQVSGTPLTNCGSTKFVLSLTQVDKVNYNSLPETLTANLTIIQKVLDTTSIKFENKITTFDKDSKERIEATGFESLGLSARYTYYVDGEVVNFQDVGTNGAGVYRVVASFVSEEILLGNVAHIADKEAYFIVNKKEIDYNLIKFNDKVFTYDKTEHMLDDATCPYNISFTYSASGKTNAGIYKIYAYPDINSQNYTTKNYRNIEATLTISKAKYDMSGIKFNNISSTYDGLPKVAKIQGKLPTGVTCDYENNEQINSGNYTATVRFVIPDAENFEKIEDMQCKIEISPRKVDVKLKEDTFVYSGQCVRLEVVIDSGILEGDNCTAIALNDTAVNYGSYTTGVSLNNSNYTPSKSSLKFVIKKADLDMSQISFESITTTYDGNAHIPKLEGDVPAGLVPNFVMGSLINAGEYIVYVDFSVVNENYNKPQRLTANVIINKKPILLEFSGLTGLVEDGNKKDINVKFIGVIEKDFDGYKKIYSQEPISAGKYILTIELNENSNYEILGVNSIKFEILTNSKSYQDENFQMQIEGNGFSQTSEVSIVLTESNWDEKLQNEGVELLNYEAFKIVMSGVSEVKSINVTLKTNSVNLANGNNIKLFKIRDGILREIECEVYNNQIVFEASIGDELILVEEKVNSGIDNLWIFILSGVTMLAIALTLVLLIKKRKTKKQVNHFIEDK